MSSYVLKDYLEFVCQAGACEDTCCAGWRIVVPGKDYLRFQKIEPVSLREKILKQISQKGDAYYFQNRADGRCSMLLEDGLCQIQKETSEKVLCHTCRKYPRLFYPLSGKQESMCVSMAASCPVIAHTLVTGEVTVYQIADGKAQLFSDWQQEMPWYAFWRQYEAGEEAARAYLQHKSNVQGLFDGMRFLAAEVCSALSNNREESVSRLLEGLLPLVQSDDTACHDAFLTYHSVSGELWHQVKTNYMAYRIFSRGTDTVVEPGSVLTEIQGELLLVQTLVMGFMMQEGMNTDTMTDIWEKAIRIMYRNCAHGKKTVQILTSIFHQMFTQEVLWNFILL